MPLVVRCALPFVVPFVVPFVRATDPDCRRRGYARACMEALVAWFRESGAGSVRPTASAEAEPLYVSLGFRRRPDPLMQLDLWAP